MQGTDILGSGSELERVLRVHCICCFQESISRHTKNKNVFISNSSIVNVSMHAVRSLQSNGAKGAKGANDDLRMMF